MILQSICRRQTITSDDLTGNTAGILKQWLILDRFVIVTSLSERESSSHLRQPSFHPVVGGNSFVISVLRCKDQVVFRVKRPDRRSGRWSCCYSPQFVSCVQMISYTRSLRIEGRTDDVMRKVIHVLEDSINIQKKDAWKYSRDRSCRNLGCAMHVVYVNINMKKECSRSTYQTDFQSPRHRRGTQRK